MCLVAINEAAFLSLRGTTDLSHASFRYLKHISIYNDFLRITIAKWIFSGFVDLSLLSANMAPWPLRKLPPNDRDAVCDYIEPTREPKTANETKMQLGRLLAQLLYAMNVLFLRKKLIPKGVHTIGY